jgi:hypothetical protein
VARNRKDQFGEKPVSMKPALAFAMLALRFGTNVALTGTTDKEKGRV